MDSEKKNTLSTLLIFVTLSFITILIDFLYHNDYLPDNVILKYISLFYLKYNNKIIIFKIIYIVLLAGTFYLSPSYKFVNVRTNKERLIAFGLFFFSSLMIIFGFINIWFYDNIVYILLIAFNIFFASYAIPNEKSNFKEEDLINKNSNLKGELSFNFKTENGILVVHSPQQGIWIEGGAGSGKSASLVEPIIYQSIKNNMAGLIYDYKGNPPTLGLTAYNSILQTKSKINFAIINFAQLKSSLRCNPLSPKYLHSYLYAMESSDIIMKNLNKSWIKKTDFWADNAINYFSNVIWYLRVYRPDICTLPHAVSLALSNYEDVLNLLSTDSDIKKAMSSIIVAHEKNAESQIAGIVSSVQISLNKLYNREVFWIMGSDELDLDITNKNNPTMLTVCNNPKIQQSLSPAISLIISTCIQQMNTQGKQPSSFIIDEQPTIYIKDLDNLPATARSNKVCTILAAQDYSQLENNYSKEEAKTIISNLGNQFTGMTNNQDTARRVSGMYGKIKKQQHTFSQNDNNITKNEQIQMEEILQARDVFGQNIGHFMGKIAGGKPPFFSTTFEYFDHKKIFPNKINEIPEFGLQTNSGDINLDRKIFDNLVEVNFEKINQDINDLLEEVKNIRISKQEKE